MKGSSWVPGHLWWLALLNSLAMTCAGAQTFEAQRDGVLETVDYTTPVFTPAMQCNPCWQTELQKIGSSYIRLRIEAEGTAPDGTVLRLYDAARRLIREYPLSDLLTRGSVWSAAVPGGYALVTVNGEQPAVGLKIAIRQIAYQSFGGAPLSTVGEDEKQPIADYSDEPLIARIKRPVARLVFIKEGIPRTCTGFLIETGELMTNDHCVDTQEVCDTMHALFGYEYDKGNNIDYGEQFECIKFDGNRSSSSLDYSVSQLNGNPAKFWGTLNLSSSDPDRGTELFIVQHPAGEPKKISKKNCRADLIPVDGLGTETDFTHSCDTVGGSSGSPVFNSTGDVVGLHHYGYAEGGKWTENRAVRMKRISENLAK